VNEHHAGDRHAELLAVREVKRAELPGLVILREHHLLLRALHRAPPADLPLQRPHLARLELARTPPAQLVHQRRRL